MKAYSVDLRERVLAAFDRGMPRAEVVRTFQVSLASIKRWLAARRNTGDFSPQRPNGGSDATITQDHHEQLRAQVAAFPDATLAEHASRLEAAVAQALKHISSKDARAFFTHCGFRFRPDLAQWFCS
jgi:transposase